MKFGRFGTNEPEVDGESDEYNDPPRPFIEHLVELRTCVVRCLMAWAICVVGIVPFAPKITEWLLAPAGDVSEKVQGIEWTSGIDVILKIMLWGGTALSLPALLYFIMKFVFPGLKRSERSAIVFGLGGSTALFLGGVYLAYAKTLKIAFEVFEAISKWVNVPVDMVRIDNHISIVLKTIIAFGIAFQVPLVILFLGWIGVVSAAGLRKKRRIAIVITFAMAMLLTPPDPVSQIMMALPMCVLYEVCIWVISLREIAKKKRRNGKYETTEEQE